MANCRRLLCLLLTVTGAVLECSAGMATVLGLQEASGMNAADAAEQYMRASAQIIAPNTVEGSYGDKSVPLSSSVILFDVGDMSYTVRQNGRQANWCALIANNIRKFGSDKINFVLTQYWMPVSRTEPFDIKNYCYREHGGGPCKPFTWDVIRRFETQMANCFATAIAQGFKTIMVTPHLDNAKEAHQWRNYLKMNPTKEHDGFTYWDMQLYPLANAINKNLGKGSTFLFNIAGEMGTSLFGWPGKWIELMDNARGTALANGKSSYAKELQMGFKINFERVPGYSEDLPGGLHKKKFIAKQLFDNADFIAISAYAPQPAKPDPNMMADSVIIADEELQEYGITLKGKDIWYGEFGIGGGTSQYCDKLAKTEEQAGRTPQYGTCWQFNPALNPWGNPKVKSYMREYYAAALDWLKAGGSGANGQWKVKGVFAWNLVSWDVQGVHPLSYAGDGESFKDTKVSQAIADHNHAIAS